MIYISVVFDCLAKLLFCYRLCVRAGEMRYWRAAERCWPGGSFERELANFANFAILNQINFPIVHKYFESTIC